MKRKGRLLQYFSFIILLFIQYQVTEAQINLNNAQFNLGSGRYLVLTGNLYNNGVLIAQNSSTVKLQGDLQTIDGTNPPTFDNLVIAGTNNKQFNINTYIGNTLTFTGNKIIIGNNNLVLNTAASISGADKDKFVVTAGTGSLVKNSLPSSTDFLFPVGDAVSSYKAVMLNNSGTQDDYSVRVSPGVLPTTGNDNLCVQYTYYIKENTPGGSNASLKLGWNTTDQGSLFDPTQAMIWHYITGTWTLAPGPGGAYGNLPATDWAYKVSGITDFSAANSAFIVRNSPVLITHAGNDVTICVGSSTQLQASGGLTFLWSPATGLSSVNISNPIASPTTTTTYTVTATDGYGNTATDDVVVTVNPLPTTANAGPDQTGISICGLTSTTLAANTPTIGTGSWSIVSGTGGTITDPSSPTSTFSGAAGSTYTLRWSISNPPCAVTSTDDVVITFWQNPTTANAGPDQSGPSTCGLTTVTLAANTPVIGTGSWSIVNGSGGSFSDPSIPSSTFSGVAGSTYTLRWTIINGPCTSSSDDVVITFHQNPIANAGTDQFVCQGSTVTLTATGGVSYNWNNGVTNGVPFVINTTTTYIVTVTDIIGCTASDNVIINVYPLPGANAARLINGNNFNLGAGRYLILPGNLVNNAGGVITNGGSINVEGNFINNSSFVSQVSSAVRLQGGTQNIGGSNPTTFNDLYIEGCDNKILGITTNVSHSLVFNTNKIIAGNYDLTMLTGTTITGADSNKYVVTTGTGSLVRNNLQSSTDYLFPVGASVTSYKPVVLNNSGIADNYSARVAHGILPSTGNDNLCVQYTYYIKESTPGGSNASLKLGWNTADHGSLFDPTQAMIWQYLNGSWTMIPGTGGASNNMPATNWAYQEAGITDFSAGNSAFIVRNSAVLITHAGNDVTICTGSSTQLQASGGLTFSWSPATGLSSTVIPNPVASPTSTTIYTVTATNGYGNTASDAVVVTVNPLPTISNAGPDQTGSSTCGLTSVSLAANTPVYGTGSWSIVSGTGGSFADPSSPVSAFSGIAGSTYTLRWTITNPPCALPSTDDVVITFNQNPTIANAGTDQTGPSTCGLTTVTLAGNTPSVGTGLWSIVSGIGGSLTNPSSPAATFSGVAGSTYTLRWTISNSPCTASSDDMIVTFYVNPTALAGSDQIVCQGTSVTLTASGGISYNWNNGVTNGVPFTPVMTSTYIVTVTDAHGCTATDDVVVTVNALPGPNAAQLINGNNFNLGAGRYLVLPGNLINKAGAVIKNSGSINLQGDFINNSSFISQSGSAVLLQGGTQNIGGSNQTTFNDLYIAGCDDKTISIPANVGNSLSFVSKKIIISNYDLNLLAGANTTGAGIGKYVVTNGTGRLVKNNLALSSAFLFPVGDINNKYTPLTLKLNSATFGPSPLVAVRVINAADPNFAGFTDHLNRYWDVTSNDITGMNADMTYIYDDADIVGNENLYAAARWNLISGISNVGTVNPATNTVSAVSVTEPGHYTAALNCTSSTATINPPGNVNICPGTSVTLTASPGISYHWSNGASSQSISVSSAGSYTVSLTNNTGCTAASSATVVTTNDNIPPVPNLPSLPAITDECSATVTVIPTATDNCAGTISGTTNDPLTYNTQGTHYITWKFDDNNGNTNFQTQAVIIHDVTAPAISCPANITEYVMPGTCARTITYATPVGTDNCPGAVTSQIGGFGNTATYPVGVTTNIFKVSDAAGLTATCSFTVTIIDNQPPTPNVPVLPTVTGECSATVTAVPQATDNCTGLITGTTTDPLTYTSQGTFTISWSYSDGNGNISTQTQTVIVHDITPPAIACPSDITVSVSPEDCGAVVTYADPVVSDNCTTTLITQTAGLSSGTSFPVGVTTNSFTVTDAGGNTANCSFTVTVLLLNRKLNLKAYLEGLYNSGTGKMNTAMDYDINFNHIPKWGADIADTIYVELHDAGNYGTIVYTAKNISLHTDGTATTSVPTGYNGEYYITVRQRNHLETTTSGQVSFNNCFINYDFTDNINKAYGNNMKLINGIAAIYAGEVSSPGHPYPYAAIQDGVIDINDIQYIFGCYFHGDFGYGYTSDVNGDGTVDLLDAFLAFDNYLNGVYVSKP